MKRHLLIIFTLVLLAPAGMAQETTASAPSVAQDFNKSKLDQYFDALEAGDRFMGSVAVSRNGELIYSRSLGFADIAKNKKANASTKYRIGSISKTFTTVLVMKAVEDGKLELDQTIDRYFPAIKNADKITIGYLLYHRSGIHSFTDDPGFLTWNTQAKTEAEMVALITEGGIDFEPNAQSAYSNSNFVLLTFILENCFGKPYPALVDSLIAEPADLHNTYMGGKINTDDHEALSYQYSGKWDLSDETDSSIPLGAGAIVSTPGDLVKFSDALFGGKLISAESLNLMKTIQGNFGMGLIPIPFYEYAGLGHTGGIDGFSSVFSHFANGNISYALTSNGTNFNNNDISVAVLSALFGKEYSIPEFSGFEASEDDLESYEGIYSSPMIPLKITITTEKGKLMAQATGQPAFPLEATARHEFSFPAASVVIEFNPSEKSLILKQGGGQFKFTRE